MTEPTPTNKNEWIGVVMLIGFLLIAGMIVAAACIGYVFSVTNANTQTPSVITPIPTQTPVSIITVPPTITFKVLKSNAAQAYSSNLLDREFNVLTTNGDIIVFPDYYTWDIMVPQQSYTCGITSEPTVYGRKVYTVSGCNLYGYTNYVQPVYYYTEYNTRPYNGDRYYYTYYHNNNQQNEEDYKYYHYRNEYWQCRYGTCDKLTVNRIPSFVDIYEMKPPFFT